jgi:hypothetical protein
MADLADTNVRANRLTSGTLIPLGNLFVLLTGVAGGAVWCAKMDARVSNIEAAVESLVDGDWSQRDMATWAELLQSKNPTISVPTVQHR